jgi:phospholipid transport system substrate-binding protein
MTRLAILFFAVLLCWPAPSQGDDGTAAARQVVESLHEQLLSCMKEGDELGFGGRYERIVTTLDETFDLPFMARAAVSSAWKGLTPEERAEFVDITRRLSASRYAENFSSYDGQRFDTLGVEPAARGTIVVKTQLIQPNDNDVKFDYRLRSADNGWRVIDIQLQGTMSELAIRRGQYRSKIESDGFPGLVKALEERIEELSEG